MNGRAQGMNFTAPLRAGSAGKKTGLHEPCGTVGLFRAVTATERYRTRVEASGRVCLAKT
jgi:hypothetical protein